MHFSGAITLLYIIISFNHRSEGFDNEQFRSVLT